MPASVTYLTPKQFSQVVYGGHEYYINGGQSPDRQDKQVRPFYKWINGRKTKRPFIRGQFNYNVQLESDATLQEPYARTRLEFQEDHAGDTMTFDGVKTWLGLEILHDELRDQGYIIKNASTFKSAGKLSDAKKIELVQGLQEKFTRFEDRWEQLHDIALHGDGTGDVSLSGLASLFPVDNTSGDVGGISRAANPVYRHVVTGVLTSTAGGTLREGLDNAIREANRYSMSGVVDIAFCGSGFIDAVKKYAELNNLSINSDVSGMGKVDPSIPDSSIHWQGIRLIWDPSIDTRAISAGDASIAKTAYFLNSGTIELAYDMYRDFSRPSDEFDLMVSRFGWMSRMQMWCRQPNANVLARVA